MKKLFILTAILLFQGLLQAETQPPLHSWNDGASREAIISFVEAVVDPDSSHFIPEAERIATFDNDGKTSKNKTAIHRNGLPTDAGGSGLSACKWFQDLYRLRRRY